MGDITEGRPDREVVALSSLRDATEALRPRLCKGFTEESLSLARDVTDLLRLGV